MRIKTLRLILSFAFAITFTGVPTEAATVRAGFDQGTKRNAVDAWRGAPGKGWKSLWYYYAKGGTAEPVTGYPRATLENPFGPELGYYLDFAFRPMNGAILDERNVPHASTSRELDPKVIDPTQPYDVRLKIRLENRWASWGDGPLSRLVIGGGFAPHSYVWGIQGSAEGWKICNGDPRRSDSWIPTEMAAEPGVIVDVYVKVNPAAGEYEVMLSNGKTQFQSPPYRLAGGPKEGDALRLGFYGWLDPHSSPRGGNFAFDEVELSQPPTLSLSTSPPAVP